MLLFDFAGSSPLCISYFIQEPSPYTGGLVPVQRNLCQEMFDVIANESLWCMKLKSLPDLSGVTVDGSLLWVYNGQDNGANRNARIKTLDMKYYLSSNDRSATYAYNLTHIAFESVPAGEAPQLFNMNLTPGPISGLDTLSNVIDFSIPHSVIR